MNNLFKESGKLFLKTVAAGLLNIIIVISITMLTVALFAETAGYVGYATKEGEPNQTYSYYYADGEDTKLKEYEDKGYSVEQRPIKLVSDKKNNIFLVISQFFTTGILVSFIYPSLWTKGFKDRNTALTNNQAPDYLKGFKIGILASAPAFLITLIFTLLNLSPQLFKFFNASYYSLIQFTVGKATAFSDLAIWRILIIFVILLITPLIAGLCYYLGFKDISIGEKLIYNKKKEV